MSRPIYELYFVANLLIYKMENDLPRFVSIDEVNNYSKAVCDACNREFAINACMIPYNSDGGHDWDRFIKYSPHSLGYMPVASVGTLRKYFRATLPYEILISITKIEKQMSEQNRDFSSENGEDCQL